ncbi:PPE family protein [Mycobacterium tuberculosis variant caprae]|uniref:PPE family protein n=1 Tax=Mycobacterium tuberculosis TaxID=1773 RepID=UPI003A8DAA51
MPFALTPAHQISYQMYAGPGADSMRAASQQLRELAFSADTTADSLNDTLFDLDDTWIGGSSAFMTDAALRYLKWLSKHSKRLWQTANTIHHLANTYEDIRQRVVPPAAIEDNREEVRRLIASDITGENAPAIAELDEQYQSYGDTNVQAMNLYAERAQTLLSQLPRWQEPPQIHQRGRGG